jgi:hypothetical protein
MSVLAVVIVNSVLAAALVTALVRFHLWAILTAHRDHVPVAAEPAPVILIEDQRPEVLVEGVELVSVPA